MQAWRAFLKYSAMGALVMSADLWLIDAAGIHSYVGAIAMYVAFVLATCSTCFLPALFLESGGKLLHPRAGGFAVGTILAPIAIIAAILQFS